MSKLWIANVLALLIAGALLGRWLARWWRGVVMARRRRQGARGEQEAIPVLEDAGYRILDDQHALESALLVDGEPRSYNIRADFLVSRGGKRYVAEVKTGARAPDPTYDRTRRQLLEYALCYPVDGVLLVDMEQRRIHEIAWEGLSSTPPKRRWRSLLWPVVVALGVGLITGLLLAAR